MWTMLGWSEQGRLHKKWQIPCQDKYCITENEEVQAAALADGAGSASFSHYGAEAVTKATCTWLCGNFDRIYTSDSCEDVRKELLNLLSLELDQQVQSRDCNREDLASTLLAVGVKKDQYIALHLGDGVIGYITDKKLGVLSEPLNGEFANETVFVTSENAVTSMKLFRGSLSDIKGFVLMTDGTGASLYRKKENELATAANHLFWNCACGENSAAQDNLKEAVKLFTKRTVDDCGIVIMTDQSSFVRANNGKEEGAPDGRSFQNNVEGS